MSAPNKIIRLESFKQLRKRKDITPDELQELKNDPSALIRREAVTFLFSSDQPPSDQEVKYILVKPQKSQKRGGFLGGMALTQFDETGEAYYNEYLFSKYYKMPEKKLLKILQAGSIYNDTCYFALCSRYFRNHSKKLRENVDEQFKGKFEDHIDHLKTLGCSDKDIAETQDLEDFLRQKLTRKGLDLLCNMGDTKDLDRIRRNMLSGYVRSSDEEIKYMKKRGEWEDVPPIIKARKEGVFNILCQGLFLHFKLADF